MSSLGVLGELRRPTEWEVVLPQLQQIPQLNGLKAPQPALKRRTITMQMTPLTLNSSESCSRALQIPFALSVRSTVRIGTDSSRNTKLPWGKICELVFWRNQSRRFFLACGFLEPSASKNSCLYGLPVSRSARPR